ncbi:MAG: aminotransferase class I/II-fold pyridoxal phosphate-dependent enzyme [Lachnospiraceae bacterium]|nr:aminotransferase class I/II-fold pyridoxal phosphate-dependent enzyme [Lachnospiraceae bacterium]
MNYTTMSKEALVQLEAELKEEYKRYQKLGLKLDMSRGKPSSLQLNVNNEMLKMPITEFTLENGLDVRNYGGVDGIPEMKRIFSDLLGIPTAQIIIGGNSSLNMMYDTMMRLFMLGLGGHEPWKKLDKVKWICPSPGYDRHFAITETLGVEMITIPMTPTGPDMDMIEKLVAEDPAIRGMWCIPLYSNPQGIIYSDETVKRLAYMETAAPDFRIFWDNAYGIHHLFSENKIADILALCKEAGHADRVLYYFSTSKISLPGGGIAMMAADEATAAEVRGQISIQTIGPDKVNQLRHARYFKDADGVRARMRDLARHMVPKYQLVLDILDEELGGTGLLSWHKPEGGYFITVDTLPGCAKETVALAKAAGVVLTGAGATYPYGKDPRDTNIRLAPSYPPLDELEQAMRLFCLCVKLAGVKKLLAE